MIGTLTVVDDVLPRDAFLAYRDMALAAEFATVVHPRERVAYRQIAMLPGPEWTMQHVIANALNVDSIQLLSEFLRRAAPGDGAGNIHCDNGEGQWGSVFYLNSDAELRAQPSGTAFWKHRWLGKDRLPIGIEAEVVDKLNAERDDPSKWDPLFQMPAVENRLIVYPTNVFHSRWPLQPAAGRIVHVAFFNVV